MNQRAVEGALGRLVCDACFRRHFRDNAGATIVAAGVDCTATAAVCCAQIGFEAVKAPVLGFEQQLRGGGLTSGSGATAAVWQPPAV